ncbi:hypothetical protein EAS56_23340 [Bradyrhizobium guangzhouense]|uniref:Uncharacterized protein n=1 Tax=Bradyrhizobium guangzhouense TaxID=1325095 RepID=A0AAE5X547_9BRAD|nr:hypothetical protein XH91_29115 [Bradyrhizobium guangzhouense]RXH10208.1 hypothetical protein EAS56_23340 [Bradyrhizobium guangzhouense]
MALASRTRSHSPRRRGIQYAVASRLSHCCLGLLDRPVKPGDDSECVDVGTPSHPTNPNFGKVEYF